MSNQDISKKIIVFLTENPGSKARNIANAIEVDKKQVNRILYAQLKSQCRQDSDYKWYLSGDFKASESVSTQSNIDTPLTKLCNYYTSCVAEDAGARVRVFAQSRYGLDYKELDTLPTSLDEVGNIFESEEGQGFLNTSRRDKSQALYFGYPVVLSHAKSSRTGWEGYFVSPVFLFPIEIEGSRVNLDFNFATINRDILERYTGTKGEDLVRALITLEEGLGIGGEKGQPGLDELAQRLKNLHPEWPWVEDIDPYSLDKKPPLQKCTKEGIFNRAVIAKVKEAPNNFTQGLESELKQLAKLPESEYKDTALGQWLSRDVAPGNEKNLNPLLEVFPMNLEQREAVQNALINKLTVITGPPGTGKSQVVTNLLINAAWQKKRVLFASKNNKAVDVVESRVNNIGTRPTLMRLGSGSDYQNQLVSHISGLLATNSSQQDEQDFAERKQEFEDTNAELLNIDSQINDFVLLRNMVDELDRDIDDIRNDLPDDLFTFIKETDFSDVWPSIDLLLDNLKSRLKPRVSFLEKIKAFIFGGRIDNQITAMVSELEDILSKVNTKPPTATISESEQEVWQLFNDRLRLRWNQIKRINKYFDALEELQKAEPLEELTKQRLYLLRQMSDKSLAIWKLWLKLQVKKLSPSDRSLLSQYRSTLQMVSGPNPERSVWKSYFNQSQKISHILSTWAITSLSARGRLPFNKDVFDLVVFDESSQCDIASALPLLYRAKQAVVIGDPKQLSHISSISDQQDQRLLEKNGLLGTYSDWAYSYSSLFDLASGLSQGAGIIDLRDHYRSHADIINFSNKFFYEGRLRIATRYNSLKRIGNEESGIRWINIEGRAEKASSGSGSQNRQEAEAIVMELQRFFKQGYEGTIGVVSPFRAQANLIRKLVNDDERLFAWLSKPGCEFISETVHKFQGDERDIIIFSPVISKGMPTGSKLFLQKTGNLFNVAITRARAMLIVVGNHNALLHSDVSYMEGFAQHVNDVDVHKEEKMAGQTDFGPDYPTVKNPEKVSDWERLFYQALYTAGIHTIPQYQEEMYTLDFAILDGDRKLNIEIDGEYYHKDWTGELCYRDQMRNQRMFELGWDVMRFWVYEIRDDLAGSIERVKNWQVSK